MRAGSRWRKAATARFPPPPGLRGDRVRGRRLCRQARRTGHGEAPPYAPHRQAPPRPAALHGAAASYPVIHRTSQTHSCLWRGFRRAGTPDEPAQSADPLPNGFRRSKPRPASDSRQSAFNYHNRARRMVCHRRRCAHPCQIAILPRVVLRRRCGSHHRLGNYIRA